LRTGRAITIDGKQGDFYALTLGYSERNPFKVTIRDARQGFGTSYTGKGGSSGTRHLGLTGPASAATLVFHPPHNDGRDFTIEDNAVDGSVRLSFEK
jgi:hypothetical protein